MEDERQRRIKALRALGSARDDATADVPPRRGALARRAHPRPVRRGPSRRPIAFVSLGVLLALAALAAGARWARMGAPTRPQGHTTGPIVFARRAGLACISPPAWALDGRTFAVLGTPTPCGSLFAPSSALAQPDPAQELAVFAADTGQVVRVIPLAHLLPSVPTGTADCARAIPGLLSLCYDLVLWSPDGRSIALRFAAPGVGATVQSLLIVSADGVGAARVVPGRAYTPPPRADGQTFPPLAVWDLKARTVRYAPVPPGFSIGARIAWGPAGTLSSSASAAASPIGNPSGDASFTPWQPGTLAPGSTADAPPLFTAAYGAGSPDGRYVATGLLTSVELVSAPAVAGDGGIPARAPRDAALVALASQWRSRGIGHATVAWQPAGRYLVAVSCVSGTIAQVRVLATSDDHLAASLTFTAPDPATGCSFQFVTAAWSPDGGRIVLASPRTGGLRVWAPSLP